MNQQPASSEIASLLEQAIAGEHLSEVQALHLFEHAELQDLGLAAQMVRNRLNAPGLVSYVVDRNVNYTNVCNIFCSFCAFQCRPGDPAGYVLTKEELKTKVKETKSLGGTGFLLQGGVNPDLPWSYYLELVNYLHHDLGMWVHGFSPIEIQAMARLSGQSLLKTLQDLREAGLGSLPGGGAEILVDRIRKRISPKKGTATAWLEVMDAAHEAGLMTTGTMMFGIGETYEDRVEHFRVLREQQDRAASRGWIGRHTAFAAWPFQSGNTPWEGKIAKPTDVEYLKTISIARLYLDNFQHIQSSWVTMGRKTGQLALHFGCDDMGSLMIEENVVSSAGTCHSVNRSEITHLIEEAGFSPWQRDNIYRPIPLES
jgi:cyclic dehypoxanthinyl futalosine synthase